MIHSDINNQSSAFTRDEVECQLAKILNSREFRNSPRLQKLLKFVVDKFLSGDASTIKAYTIAVDAYNKPHEFDASDPYVRNIARDVRKSLSVFYLDEGLTDRLRIELPVGSYVPVVRLQQPVLHNFNSESPVSVDPNCLNNTGLRPVVAVIPPFNLIDESARDPVGEVIASEIVSGISACEELQVISQLSTLHFQAKLISLEEIETQLKADYVITGSYRSTGSTTKINVELVEVRSKSILWSERTSLDIDQMLRGSDTFVSVVVAETCRMIIGNELQRALYQSPDTLENYTLVIAGVRLMHRASIGDFEKAKKIWETLTKRTSRLAIPHAQLAKWHVLSYTRGWVTESKTVARNALECTALALDKDSHCTLALTVDGFIHTNIVKDLDRGEQRYRDALGVNPNNSLAWLLLGTLNAFKGKGEHALKETAQALRLSPLDPLQYFYESLAATAALSAGRYERALELAKSSLSLNKTHTSTFRALAIAQIMLDQEVEAKNSIANMLKLDPTLTAKTFLERSPSADYQIGKTWAKALEAAGLPKS